ncbi:hypothetical protein CI102_8927 [Trichoderma harzianum]|uniref:Uncharacterized protein n=1 Tax=Trichoderma harzianum CBS 226.95 TaxID=983964 RepID=A0A2T4ARW2_TRIHA|nr:hypothetical protein M431DRAFT_74635 [Trichoderma harzianum CBS 226.95]PKK46782.1 hypothetical protein CI102_8927 [Trichoderma harzianum]PTB59783.1 hypothetical protein M431DRAFT_74635 [Trichoderma harzianum CBS 226.95]
MFGHSLPGPPQQADSKIGKPIPFLSIAPRLQGACLYQKNKKRSAKRDFHAEILKNQTIADITC